MASVSLVKYAVRGALIDLLILCVSFLFFFGPHGPIGPIFVLWVLNWPGTALAHRVVPAEWSSNVVDPILAFATVVLTGAVYGLVFGVVMMVRRRRAN
jgi:hypothetical protein